MPPIDLSLIVWMGLDAFPRLSITSLIEFDRQLKPAARSVGEAFREKPASKA
jgi:hypothetical protein